MLRTATHHVWSRQNEWGVSRLYLFKCETIWSHKMPSNILDTVDNTEMGQK